MLFRSSQDDTAAGTAKYNGIALYGTYMLSSKWRGVVRLEQFDDKQGFHFATGGGTKYTEVTATVSYLPNSSVELRGEVRGDRANNAVFIDSDGSSAKTLQTLGVQGIYKF